MAREIWNGAWQVVGRLLVGDGSHSLLTDSAAEAVLKVLVEQLEEALKQGPPSDFTGAGMSQPYPAQTLASCHPPPPCSHGA